MGWSGSRTRYRRSWPHNHPGNPMPKRCTADRRRRCVVVAAPPCRQPFPLSDTGGSEHDHPDARLAYKPIPMEGEAFVRAVVAGTNRRGRANGGRPLRRGRLTGRLGGSPLRPSSRPEDLFETRGREPTVADQGRAGRLGGPIPYRRRSLLFVFPGIPMLSPEDSAQPCTRR